MESTAPQRKLKPHLTRGNALREGSYIIGAAGGGGRSHLTAGPCVSLRSNRREALYGLSGWGEAPLAIHVNITAKPVGSLNLYTWSRHYYDADDIYVGYLLADQIGAALGAVIKIENMGIGMTGRTVIGPKGS